MHNILVYQKHRSQSRFFPMSISSLGLCGSRSHRSHKMIENRMHVPSSTSRDKGVKRTNATATPTGGWKLQKSVHLNMKADEVPYNTFMAALPNLTFDNAFHLSIPLLTILLLWSVLTIKSKKPFLFPPGPPGLPIANLHQLSNKQPHLSLHRTAQKHGYLNPYFNT